MDELIAVLGATLQCTRYALAWYAESPSRMEHRCAISIDEAMILEEDTSAETVFYAIDMKVARKRYGATYRFGGTPTPAVVLAQLLSRFATQDPKRGSAKQFSPLIVYSVSGASLLPSASMVTSPPEPPQRKELAFPP